MKEVALESVSRAPAFSDVAIRLGYLCLHARVAGLSGTAEQVETLLTADEVEEFNAIVEELGLQQCAYECLAAMAAARAQQRAGDVQALTKKQYDDARAALLASSAVAGVKGAITWPPTSQTLMSRMGGGFWNDAVRALGMRPQAHGRARGELKFSAADYRAAVGEFLQEQRLQQAPATAVEYASGVTRQKRGGCDRPSMAAVRIHFGSWNQAKRVALDAN